MATQMKQFQSAMKSWENLTPMPRCNLSNREILKDTTLSICTLVDCLKPYLKYGARPIPPMLLAEAVGQLQSNVRWLKVILERHKPQPKPVKVTMEEVLPY